MAAAIENGMVRLVLTYPDDMPIPGGTIFEERTENTARSTTFSEQIPMFAPDFPVIGEDYKLKLFFKSDAADTVVRADSVIKLNVMKYKTDKNGGVISTHKSVLKETDLMAASVVCAAGVWQEMGSYTVGAGEGLQVGDMRGATLQEANGRLYLLFKDDTA